MGAWISSSGASARMATSKRTWSFPAPVQPWAILDIRGSAPRRVRPTLPASGRTAKGSTLGPSLGGSGEEIPFPSGSPCTRPPPNVRQIRAGPSHRVPPPESSLPDRWFAERSADGRDDDPGCSSPALLPNVRQIPAGLCHRVPPPESSPPDRWFAERSGDGRGDDPGCSSPALLPNVRRALGSPESSGAPPRKQPTRPMVCRTFGGPYDAASRGRGTATRPRGVTRTRSRWNRNGSRWRSSVRTVIPSRRASRPTGTGTGLSRSTAR